jgi:hypothetical protein
MIFSRTLLKELIRERARRDLDKNSFESKEQLSPLFERFLFLAGPEGLGRKTFKIQTQWISGIK